MWLFPRVPPTPPSHLLVRENLPGSPGGGLFFTRIHVTKADPITLCRSGLRCREGKENGFPCPVKKALHDRSSAVRLRWKDGHKALALAGSFVAEENSDPGGNTAGLHARCVTHCDKTVHAGKLGALLTAALAFHSILFWVWFFFFLRLGGEKKACVCVFISLPI